MLITAVIICFNIGLDKRNKPVKRLEYVAYLKFEFVTNKKDEVERVIATKFLSQIRGLEF
jgi:hypothetical protein